MSAPLVTQASTDAPSDENRRLKHKWCLAERALGINRGLCGTPILGIPPKPGRLACRVCGDLVNGHRTGCAECLTTWGLES